MLTSVLSQDAGGLLRRGYAWWTGELAGLLPGILRQSWHGETADAVMMLETGHLRLAGSKSRRATTDAAEAEEACWARIAQLGRARQPVRIHLHVPRSACLVRTIDVPLAAVANAASILALDLERALPFERDDVYTAHTVEPVRPAPGMARLCQLIVKRSKIDPVVERIEAAGPLVTRIDALSDDGTRSLGVNFLSLRNGVRSGAAKRRSAVKPLATIAAALALSAAWITVTRHETAVAELEEQLAAARSSVAAAQSAQTETGARLLEMKSVSELKTNRAEMVRIVEEVTRLLPDSAWLTDLSIADGVIDMSGFANQAAGLLPVLEASPLFTDAAPTSPVTLDASRNQERFSFRLRLRTTRAAAAPPSQDPGRAVPQ